MRTRKAEAEGWSGEAEAEGVGGTRKAEAEDWESARWRQRDSRTREAEDGRWTSEARDARVWRDGAAGMLET